MPSNLTAVSGSPQNEYLWHLVFAFSETASFASTKLSTNNCASRSMIVVIDMRLCRSSCIYGKWLYKWLSVLRVQW